MKIMIVEDDPVISKELKKQLENWSYEVYLTEQYQDIATEVRELNPELVLLDINLPSNNGFYWCMEIRKFSKVPIIFISSKSDQLDQVMAMQMGGDDYVTKPFDMNLLVAKIQALLRRTYDYVNDRSGQLKKAGLELDPGRASLMYKNKKAELSKTELQIMEILFRNINQFLSREEIIDHCWQGKNFIDDNTLAVNIHRLRKKLSDLGLENLIETRINVGYRLNEDVLR